MTIQILLQLLVAHVLTDFVFQPTKWINHKRKHRTRSIYLYLHALLSGVLSIIVTQQWEHWYIGIFIAVTHFFIDWWKLAQQKDNLLYFILDQLAHVLIVGVAWLWMTAQFESLLDLIISALSSEHFLIVTLGYLIILFPTGYIIDKATDKWQKEIKQNPSNEQGLDKAGRYIGVFERLLVLTFVIMNQMGAIGFLIAAKSILRYADKDKSGARKQTEYVLIGTLMSFTIAIFVGILIRTVAE